MKMNKLFIIALVSLILAACGGSSDNDTAAEPPAPEMTDDGSGSGAGDAEPPKLALSCSKQPTTTVNSGSAAKATFAFNQAINTKGTVTMSCSNNAVLFAAQSVNVISGQALISQNISAGCEESTFTIKLSVSEDNLSATCSWPVNKTLGLIKSPS